MSHAGITTPVAAILIALIAVQVAAQVYALLDLARRNVVRGGRKWVWVLVIALGNLPGAIAYLVVGRPPATVDVSGAASSASGARSDAARRAVSELYGRRDRS